MVPVRPEGKPGSEKRRCRARRPHACPASYAKAKLPVDGDRGIQQIMSDSDTPQESAENGGETRQLYQNVGLFLGPIAAAILLVLH